MNQHLALLAKRYLFDSNVLLVQTQDFEPTDWLRTVAPDTSNAWWLLGHLVATRRMLLRSLGESLEHLPWEEYFGRGTHFDADADNPDVDTLLAEFKTLGEKIAARLAGLDEKQADAPFGFSAPDGGSTMEECASFLQFHESYHIGQLGLLRRLTGKPGIA